MEDAKGRGAIMALLAENKRAIKELQQIIITIPDNILVEVGDHETKNEDCYSIQTILAHVVRSGYSYCIYIRNWKNNLALIRPEKVFHTTSAAFVKDLDAVIAYTKATFEPLTDADIEIFKEEDKIPTSWGQSYDPEQIMEHAIVHILRHRRQIEGFLKKLGS